MKKSSILEHQYLKQVKINISFSIISLFGVCIKVPYFFDVEKYQTLNKKNPLEIIKTISKN